MTDEMYCTKCGAKLEPGSQFCSSCGTSLSSMMSSTSHQNAGSGGSDLYLFGLRQKLDTCVMFTVIYGVLAFLYGLLVICAADYLVDMIKDFRGVILPAGMFIAVGAGSILSSVVAIAGACLAKKCKMFTVTIVLYLVASIASLCFALSVISLVVGLIFTYLVYECKPAFTP